MCKITNEQLRSEAVRVLAGVVSSHLRNRKINHSFTIIHDVYYFHLEVQSLLGVEIERLSAVIRGFSGNYRLECVDNFFALAIYL